MPRIGNFGLGDVYRLPVNQNAVAYPVGISYEDLTVLRQPGIVVRMVGMIMDFSQ
jgi:hypothetical protein